MPNLSHNLTEFSDFAEIIRNYSFSKMKHSFASLVTPPKKKKMNTARKSRTWVSMSSSFMAGYSTSVSRFAGRIYFFRRQPPTGLFLAQHKKPSGSRSMNKCRGKSSFKVTLTSEETILGEINYSVKKKSKK